MYVLFFILIILFIVGYYIHWRIKYWNSEKGQYKCGKCGKCEWTMYYEETFLFRKYKCFDCSKEEFFKSLKDE